MRKAKHKGFWLLSDSSDNAKTHKTALLYPEYRPAMLSLAPYTSSGYQVCPMAKVNGCFESCLFWSGRGGLKSAQATRIARTKLFFEDRARFFSYLCEDLETHIRKAEQEKQKPCVRLNGLSDPPWEAIKIPGKTHPITEAYPQVQFYDYTKIFKRLGQTPPNYHLTFSLSFASWHSVGLAKQALGNGFNVTMIFPIKRGAPIPSKRFWDCPVLDGDNHDLTFLYPSPSVIALRYKYPSNPSLRSK